MRMQWFYESASDSRIVARFSSYFTEREKNLLKKFRNFKGGQICRDKNNEAFSIVVLEMSEVSDPSKA